MNLFSTTTSAAPFRTVARIEVGSNSVINKFMLKTIIPVEYK